MVRTSRRGPLCAALFSAWCAAAAFFPCQLLADNQCIARNFGSPNPSPLVENGIVYLYTTEDPVGAGSIRNINHHVWTTTDLYHWQDSGVVLTEADVPWIDTSRDHMWAPSVFRLGDGQFHLYWPGITSNGLAHIGHAKAARPTAHFTADATWMAGCGNEALDPFVVDSGNGVYYITWDIVNITPNHVYIRKLNAAYDDAIGTQTEITAGMGTAGDYKEGMWIIRQNNVWYNFYAHWPTTAERIAYSTATNLLGPYTFRADLMNENTNSNTIHAGICFFMNRWIMFWHCGGNELGGSITTNQKRVSCAEYFFFNTATNPWSINSANTIPKTMRGAGTPSAYKDTVQIDRRSAISGASVSVAGGGEPAGWMVSSITNSAWVRYDTVDFTPDAGYRGPVNVFLRVASTVATDSIQVRLGSSTGTLLRALAVPSTGSLTTWRTIADTVPVRATGIQNVALVFLVPSGSNNLNVNWVSFGQEIMPSGTGPGIRRQPSGCALSWRRIDRNTFAVDFKENSPPPEIRLCNLRGQELPAAAAPAGRGVVVRLGPAALAPGAYLLSISGGGEAANIPFVY
jgi:arabinoxylan arabinofuranohydrolase